ncbi:hypothetical protein AB6A40_004573 [Gnathostoma spinigerum]|uniref:RNA helicase n=1 Tax=Gnathostoma spinigerum TaxID=75299 RepID=A0ABD6ECW1_9BILA
MSPTITDDLHSSLSTMMVGSLRTNEDIPAAINDHRHGADCGLPIVNGRHSSPTSESVVTDKKIVRKIGEAQGKVILGRSKEKLQSDRQIKAGCYFNKMCDDVFIEVTVNGRVQDIERIESFDSLHLSQSLMKNIEKRNYCRPSAIQMVAIPWILQGHDIVAYSETGSGKTAAFLIPIVNEIIMMKAKRKRSIMNESMPYCIIIAVTTDLTLQLFKEAVEFTSGTDCKVVPAYGGTQRGDNIQLLRKGCDILITTIGRLFDFAENNIVKFDELRVVVIDEVDQFCSHISAVLELQTKVFSRFPNVIVRRLLFTATKTDDVERFAEENLRGDRVNIVVGSVNSVNRCIKQDFIKVEDRERATKLVVLLREIYPEECYQSRDGEGEGASTRKAKPKTLIFVNTKRRCDMLAVYLCMKGFRATPTHGNRSTKLREAALNDFTSGDCNILICTNVLSRGINISRLDYVIVYEIPFIGDWESYIHRVGRTGRVGNEGVALIFYSSETDSEMAPVLVELALKNNTLIPKFIKDDYNQRMMTMEQMMRIRRAVEDEYTVWPL